MARASWKNQSYSCERYAALNGESSRELRKLVNLAALKKVGAFFTGTNRATSLLKHERFNDDSVIYDPACGSGDLLIAAAKRLGCGKDLYETLNKWNRQLLGSDRVEQFLDVTQHRLLLLAREMNAHQNHLRTKKNWCDEISKCDSLNDNLHRFESATHVVMNPPYFLKKVSPDCEWSSGMTNIAATFVEKATNICKPGTRVIAILPEVLRTGSRYERWRKVIAQRSDRLSAQSIGIFDSKTDVDVFVLRITVSNTTKSRKYATWPAPCINCQKTINDYFDVSVGPVVPFRAKEYGPHSRYIHPRNVKPWHTVRRINESRAFEGTRHAPPFVVVRRTSRPGDKHRAIGTLIATGGLVAVENHLIICMPKSGTLEDCEALLKALQDSAVTEFLDLELRCRHLTVGAVKAIPLPVEFQSYSDNV